MSLTPDAYSREASRGAAALSRGRRVLAYCLILVVLGAVAAMSWAGLYAFARNTMGWSPWHAALVPVALDVAAMACAALALDSLSRNDPAVAFRALTAALIGLSAFINYRHALASGNIAEQLFFPAMSCLSYLLIHAVLVKYRRDTRRDLAGHGTRAALEPLPRMGVLAVLAAPRPAWHATRAALTRRIPAPSETGPELDGGETVAPELDALSGAAAIRLALEASEGDVRGAVAWLSQHGRQVKPQRVYDVIRRDAAQVAEGRPQLSIAGRADQDAS